MTSASFQAPVNDSYPHRWLSFRACDGTYIDQKVRANLAWAIRARRSGRLDGFTVYVVYRPGTNTAVLDILNRIGVPADCHVMVDAETWGGQISGNQSAGLNDLAEHLASRQGSRDRVWGYANRGDWASMWPDRPPWLGCVVASYGGTRPQFPNLIGWQYTDGQYDIPGRPSSTPPFGPCDHNEFYLPAGGFTVTDVQTILAAIAALQADVDGKIASLRTDAGGQYQMLVQQIGEPTHPKTDSLRNAVLGAVAPLPTSTEMTTALSAVPTHADLAEALAHALTGVGITLTDEQAQQAAVVFAAAVPRGQSFRLTGTFDPV